MSTFLNENPRSDEEKEEITKAITAALRWYAMSKLKRDGDDCHAVTLIDLLEEIHSE